MELALGRQLRLAEVLMTRHQPETLDLDHQCDSRVAVRQERDQDRPKDCLMATEVEQVKRRR